LRKSAKALAKKEEKTGGCLPKAKGQKPKHIRGTEILIHFSQHRDSEIRRFFWGTVWFSDMHKASTYDFYDIFAQESGGGDFTFVVE